MIRPFFDKLLAANILLMLVTLSLSSLSLQLLDTCFSPYYLQGDCIQHESKQNKEQMIKMTVRIVPPLSIDLSDEQMQQLRDQVNPLEDCEDYGLNLYQCAITFLNTLDTD